MQENILLNIPYLDLPESTNKNILRISKTLTHYLQ